MNTLGENVGGADANAEKIYDVWLICLSKIFADRLRIDAYHSLGQKFNFSRMQYPPVPEDFDLLPQKPTIALVNWGLETKISQKSALQWFNVLLEKDIPTTFVVHRQDCTPRAGVNPFGLFTPFEIKDFQQLINEAVTKAE